MAAGKRKAAVTGAFSYTGQYVARALMQRDWEVITLTRNPSKPHPLQGKIKAFPLDFSNPKQLRETLLGVEVLVNTYWVRFNYPGSSFEQAVENTNTLLKAAEDAKVRRVVHISVSNPDLNSGLPYFRGKAQVETIIQSGKLSYAILRPTIIFGNEEVLINNITWLLRHLPFFGIPGDGQYRVQPLFVEDLAKIAAESAENNNNQILDTAGPEILTFAELIQSLKKLVGSRALLMHLRPSAALLMAKVLGLLLCDVLLTQDELTALMEERLIVKGEPLGQTRFSDWARQQRSTLGGHYVNELKRHHGKPS